jgi:K+-transporting ATPase ATPase C chain
MTGLAQLAFPGPAHGSLVIGSDGNPVGSELIGQDWSKSPRWLQGRPSATGDHPYNPQASGGSNLSPQGKAYADRVAADRAAWEKRAHDAGQNKPVPQALLTTSGSGLDPHLDLEAALWQVPLVAQARSLDAPSIEAAIRRHVVNTGWPWDPAPYVNVLDVNLDLDRSGPRP